MRVSIILSTYNSPEWLEKVLWGYSVQSFREFEILIADDGSNDDTPERIEAIRKATGMSIRHVWHEKNGFRKCTILNKAIDQANGDYLIFSDGDCVPRYDFIWQHVHQARPNSFLSGGTVRLPMNLSHLISKDDILSRRFTSSWWLLRHGLGRNKTFRMLLCGSFTGRMADLFTTTRAVWNGCNASAWKSDILRVNGYDERMEHGGLDREMGERLVNTGLRPLHIRHRAICLHLDHARGYVNQKARELNQEILRVTREERLTHTPYGIRRSA
jgi:glycosyltransferase involved in cell wall biosynthesis